MEIQIPLYAERHAWPNATLDGTESVWCQLAEITGGPDDFVPFATIFVRFLRYTIFENCEFIVYTHISGGSYLLVSLRIYFYTLTKKYSVYRRAIVKNNKFNIYSLECFFVHETSPIILKIVIYLTMK